MTATATTRPRDWTVRDTWAVVRDTDLNVRRLVLGVAAGTMALGSAVGLAATAAWLIARASEMPSPADVALAAVLVRFFGISRGLFRYIERLLSHDTALRGMVTLRERSYRRLASQHPDHALTTARGDIVARLGTDLDSVGDVVVRALVPVAIAPPVSVAAVTVVAIQLPVAGAALAVFLIAAAVLPGMLTARSARAAATLSVNAQAAVSTAALSAIEGASDHRVWGTAQETRAELIQADRDLATAADFAARPAAWAAATGAAMQGLALIAAVCLGVQAVKAGDISGPAGAIVALLPLAAFEAVNAVPAAVQQYFRSARSAARLTALTDLPPHVGGTDDGATESSLPPSTTPVVDLTALSVMRPGMTPTTPITATWQPGSVVGIIGRSGVGKTTLLHCLAGALPPHAGHVTVGGTPVTEAHTGTYVALTAEDAHLFGTTVRDNLLVADGGASDDDLWRRLDDVGAGPWVRSLPDGMDTVLGSGGLSVSGGERRRLLLARALVCPAPIHLIDEPGEHLDTAGREALRAALQTMHVEGRTVVVVTHDHGLVSEFDQVVDLDE